MIELLSARVVEVLAGAQACASGQDHRAAERRRTPELQRRTLAGRAALRLLAARCLGVAIDAAREIPIDRTCLDCDEPHGRPTLDGWALSSSTSGDRVLVAVADASSHPVDLGVDVEVIPSRLWDGFDEYALHPSERANLSAPGTRAGVAERVGVWTQKEAVLKATGDGLRVEPASIALSASSAARALGVGAWRHAHGLGEESRASAARPVSVRTLRLGEDARAAVATTGPRRFRLWTLGQLAVSAPDRIGGGARRC